jgi:pimeloyl-ACP methyl ester carboxylesterase
MLFPWPTCKSFNGTKLWLVGTLLLQGLSPTGVAAPLNAESIALHTSLGTLRGMLELPDGPGQFPVALIIPGSGPVDQDGNAPKSGLDTDCYRLLAEALARQGIASVRYDKRGVGASASALPRNETQTLRVSTFIDDAVAWGQLLRHDGRFSTVTIIGHSEGSLIGMIAARKIPADEFVSIAGPGQPLATLILKQLDPQLPPDAYHDATSIITGLEQGHVVSQVPPSLAPLLGPEVQPFLISLFRYNPVKEIAKLTIPILIVQGGHDLQVNVSDAHALAGANPRAQLVLIPRMNHVLKDVGKSISNNLTAYREPQIPISPELVRSVAHFIHQLHVGARKPS